MGGEALACLVRSQLYGKAYNGCVPFDYSSIENKIFHSISPQSDLSLQIRTIHPQRQDRSDWYLKLVLDCSFHLINRFIDRILDCLITWTADQKSQGNLDPGTSVWKQIRFRILCSSWSAIWSNFRLKNPDSDWSKGMHPMSTPYSLWFLANFSATYLTVDRRYWYPEEPPVPILLPIMRCTIITWLSEMSRENESKK